jgi:S-DNA-T family DNA segregation ATPase FtsK/SpoIIIE
MAFADRSISQRFAPARSAARPAVETPPAAPLAAPRNRVRDLTSLVLLAGCIFLVAALATFDAGDPPLCRAFPPNARAANACGLLGATVGGGLYEALGIGAWGLLGFLVALGAALAIAGACTLLTLFLPDWIDRPLWGPGGRVGGMGRLLAESYLARTGGAIVVTAITLGGLFLACDAMLFWLAGGGVKLVSASMAAAGAVAARLPRRRAGEDFDRLGAAEVADLKSRFPGLRSRLAGRVEDPDAEFDDADTDADGEPTVRVKRRELPVVAAAEDEPDVAAEPMADEAAADEPAPATSQRMVPIKSLSTRRKPQATLELSPDPAIDYELPSLDLLLPTEYLELDQQEQEVRDRAKVLEKTFAEFGFKVKVVEIETGPVISQYEIELEAGLRLAKITNLADDLAIALRVPSVRIVAPIPGKNSVGIEVPNTTRQMVRLREVIEETQAKSRTMKIPIYLGKDVAGNSMVVDMASLPHLLIAGRTGTGKSVCLNSIIVSMLMTRRPDEVRMLMIDPKMVELTPYKALPHLMHPVVTDMKKAEAILAWAVEKMEQRYTLLAKVGVRHLTQYNALGRDELLKRMNPETDEEAAAIPTTMPFIVMIADEIADMMMTAGKEIEAHIIRLAQKSRAVGIHLILATQKPTVDVITGLIKSNLPARIAFQVASRTDSRVVLDEMGAERLLGNGDMLFLSPGTSQILRGQGTYLSDEEIGRVMAAIGTTEPQYAAELVNLQPAPSGDAAKAAVSPQDKDELYDAAVEVVIREGRGSVSLLQRALGVGYGRGARLIDFMAEDGVVGQYAGSQAREVLLTLEQWAARNGTAPLPPDPPPRKLKIQPHASAPVVIDADEEDDAGFDDDSDTVDALDDQEDGGRDAAFAEQDDDQDFPDDDGELDR